MLKYLSLTSIVRSNLKRCAHFLPLFYIWDQEGRRVKTCSHSQLKLARFALILHLLQPLLHIYSYIFHPPDPEKAMFCLVYTVLVFLSVAFRSEWTPNPSTAALANHVFLDNSMRGQGNDPEVVVFYLLRYLSCINYYWMQESKPWTHSTYCLFL